MAIPLENKSKKVKVGIEITMWLDAEKLNMDYAKTCAKFLIDTGADKRSTFKNDAGANIFDEITYNEVITYKYD